MGYPALKVRFLTDAAKKRFEEGYEVSVTIGSYVIVNSANAIIGCMVPSAKPFTTAL